jgi:hypothetical protein
MKSPVRVMRHATSSFVLLLLQYIARLGFGDETGRVRGQKETLGYRLRGDRLERSRFTNRTSAPEELGRGGLGLFSILDCT